MAKDISKQQQELLQKMSIYEQQIQQFQQQLEAVEAAVIEMNSLALGLDELAGSKGKEILASVGRGIFAKTKLISEDLFVDIGGNNVIKKSIPETKKLIEEQIKKLEDVQKELRENLEKLSEELTNTFLGVQEKHVCDEECEHD